MYNRYIPQPDGSFRRSRVAEPRRPESPAPAIPEPVSSHQQQEVAAPPCPEETEHRQQRRSPEPRRHAPSCPMAQRTHPRQAPKQNNPEHKQESKGNEKDTGVFDFLKHLLPKDFDTGDLLIVLLLLLMSGDCAEDQNSALLTLVLYLFL